MTDSEPTPTGFGIVVIGRDEGQGLLRCLASLPPPDRVPTVYVDSGSRDGSPDAARRAGVDVVELDPALPFSAARGRNEGLAHLLQEHRDLELVQFVDGDCELDPRWLDAAAAAFAAEPKLAAVDGRLRERRPDASHWNRACDVEWDLGSPGHCLGTAAFRVAALREVGPFRADLVAGEEPELCVRLRAGGWSVARLTASMGTHDAGLHEFGQWWRRCRRAGLAYAAGAELHGDEGHWSWEHRRALLGGVVLPAAAVALAPPTLGASLVALAGAGVASWVRAYRFARARQRDARDAATWATTCVLGRLAEGQGALSWHRSRWRERLQPRAGAKAAA